MGVGLCFHTQRERPFYGGRPSARSHTASMAKRPVECPPRRLRIARNAQGMDAAGVRRYGHPATQATGRRTLRSGAPRSPEARTSPICRRAALGSVRPLSPIPDAPLPPPKPNPPSPPPPAGLTPTSRPVPPPTGSAGTGRLRPLASSRVDCRHSMGGPSRLRAGLASRGGATRRTTDRTVPPPNDNASGTLPLPAEFLEEQLCALRVRPTRSHRWHSQAMAVDLAVVADELADAPLLLRRPTRTNREGVTILLGQMRKKKLRPSSATRGRTLRRIA